MHIKFAFLILLLTCKLQAQQLSANEKTIRIEELPEYVIVNCDNAGSMIGTSIRISIPNRNSNFEKSLKDLADMLEDKKLLGISNQTDLLNTLSKLGYEFVNAFPLNAGEGSSFSRSGFVFRKKERFRN